MSLTRRALSKMAFCTSRLGANNYINVSAKDVKTLDINYNEEMRVLLVRADLSQRDLQPRDRATYITTLAKSDQFYCPKDVREKMELDTGDLVKYLLIPADEFPGLNDGPVRDKLRSVFTDVEADEPEYPDEDRPSRDTEMVSFEATMENSGQITISKQYMDALGLIKGDTIDIIVKNPENGEAEDMSLEIGTGNRVTVQKPERETLGLEQPDRPDVQVLVQVPDSVPEA